MDVYSKDMHVHNSFSTGAVTLEVTSSAEIALIGGVVIGSVVVVLLVSLFVAILLVVIKRYPIHNHDACVYTYTFIIQKEENIS